MLDKRLNFLKMALKFLNYNPDLNYYSELLEKEIEFMYEFLHKNDYQGKDKKLKLKEFEEINLHKLLETFLKVGAIDDADDLRKQIGISDNCFKITKLKILIQ